jgi:hypothetical protein
MVGAGDQPRLFTFVHADDAVARKVVAGAVLVVIFLIVGIAVLVKKLMK